MGDTGKGRIGEMLNKGTSVGLGDVWEWEVQDRETRGITPRFLAFLRVAGGAES